MFNTKHSVMALGAVAALLVTTSTLAFADGMPFSEKPKPVLTPLDQALDEIQNQEPPVEITEPAPAPAPAPAVVAAPEPEPVHAPVPESRIVEVQPDTSFFGLSVGMYDPFSHGEQAAAFNIEWQPGVKIAGFLQPLFGAMATTEGSMLGYGGVGVPFNIGKNVFLMPSVAVGAYEEGNGYDLDRTLAFRVGTEVAYQFEDKSRIGINAHIISNGKSFDRADRTEVISLVYTTPTDIFAGSNVDDEPEEQAPAPSEAPATPATEKPAPADLNN